MGAGRDEMTQNEPHLPGEKISYGDKFAYTEEMEKFSELPPLPRGGPIGSLPVGSEAPPKTHVSEVLEDAQRHLAMIQAGVRDITAAFWRLARLPVDVAVLAAKHFRPLRA